ncbi:MAG: chitosanase [Myxococcota bacterium]
MLTPEIVKKLVTSVKEHEGDFDAINPNTDGAGLSVGIFQWPQSQGGLYEVLSAYHRADPVQFAAIFGPRGQALLAHTRTKSLGPLDGALLWEEPWRSRFAQAGRHPAFQAAQLDLAERGPFIRMAARIARELGVLTERALAVALDVAVTQGSERALSYVRITRAELAGVTLSAQALLQAYITTSIRHMRREEPPSPPKKKHLSWRQKASKEWHLYAGSINLYAVTSRRRSKLMVDTRLTDHPLV